MSIVVRQTLRAPAATVYRILADYVALHPQILPPAFHDLRVLEGGVGDGTRLVVSFTVWGSTRTFEMDVTEPEPGRVLAERDRSSGTVTTFTVVAQGERACEVVIETVLPARRGLFAALERWLSRGLLTSTYRDELARLEALAIQLGAG